MTSNAMGTKLNIPMEIIKTNEDDSDSNRSSHFLKVCDKKMLIQQTIDTISVTNVNKIFKLQISELCIFQFLDFYRMIANNWTILF